MIIRHSCLSVLGGGLAEGRPLQDMFHRCLPLTFGGCDALWSSRGKCVVLHVYVLSMPMSFSRQLPETILPSQLGCDLVLHIVVGSMLHVRYAEQLLEVSICLIVVATSITSA